MHFNSFIASAGVHKITEKADNKEVVWPKLCDLASYVIIILIGFCQKV